MRKSWEGAGWDDKYRSWTTAGEGLLNVCATAAGEQLRWGLKKPVGPRAGRPAVQMPREEGDLAATGAWGAGHMGSRTEGPARGTWVHRWVCRE